MRTLYGLRAIRTQQQIVDALSAEYEHGQVNFVPDP